jgi:serralysin
MPLLLTERHLRIYGRVIIGPVIAALMFPGPARATTTVRASTIGSFTNTIGVQTHLGAGSSSPYGTVATVESALAYVGIKHVRDGIGSSADLATMQTLHDELGVTFNVLMSFSMAYGESCPPQGWTYANVLSAIQANVSLVESIEGANEVDNFTPCWSGVSSVAAGVTEQEQLWSTFRGNQTTASLPINSLTVSNLVYLPKIGNISAYVNQVSSHVYPQWYGAVGESAYGTSQSIISMNNQALAPGKPSVITEGGWWTAPAVASYGIPAGVPQLIQAKLELSFLFDNYALGVRRTFLYELFDEDADPTGTNFEDHFGLFTSAGAAKSFATALHNTQAIFADSGTISSLGSLSYTLTGMPTTGHSLVLERSDGTFILAVWNDAAIWNNTNYVSIIVSPSTITFTPSVTTRSMNVYDPLVGTSPVTTSASGSIQFSLSDHPVFVFVPPK